MQSKPGGQYREGGVYDPTSGLYTNGPKTQALVEGIQIFNKDTTQVNGTKVSGTPSLADYGKVIAGLTDFHGTDQAAIPPFAALIVKPNDEEVRGTPIESPAIGGLLPILASLLWQDNILILAWRGSITAFDFINDVALSPTLCKRSPPTRRPTGANP